MQFCLRFDFADCKDVYRVQLFFQNTKMVAKQGFSIPILCSKQAASLFFLMFKCSKKLSFRIFLRPCMHHSYSVISTSNVCGDCVWPRILGAELCATCPGEQVLVGIRLNVTFLHLRAFYAKIYTCFSKDGECLTTYDCVL